MTTVVEKQQFVHEWDLDRCFDFHHDDSMAPKFPWGWDGKEAESFVSSQLIASRFITNLLRKTRDSSYAKSIAHDFLHSGVKILETNIIDEIRATCFFEECGDLISLGFIPRRLRRKILVVLDLLRVNVHAPPLTDKKVV